MSKITKADGLANGFDALGIDDAEDREAIAEAVAGGTSLADAASELGYSLAPAVRGGSAIADSAQSVPVSAEVESIEEDAYRTGYSIIEEARKVRQVKFQEGVENALTEGAEDDARFFRTVADRGVASLKFRTSNNC
jgi:hypothetical protein